MWATITVLINKLPEGYIMFILPFIIVLGVWVFTHIRRDKQGKIIFYSAAYEANKHNKKLDTVLKEQDHADMRLMRLELLLMIYTCPEKVEIIMDLYDHYKKVGGNSYIDHVYEAWYEKYARGIIERRI